MKFICKWRTTSKRFLLTFLFIVPFISLASDDDSGNAQKRGWCSSFGSGARSCCLALRNGMLHERATSAIRSADAEALSLCLAEHEDAQNLRRRKRRRKGSGEEESGSAALDLEALREEASTVFQAKRRAKNRVCCNRSLVDTGAGIAILCWTLIYGGVNLALVQSGALPPAALGTAIVPAIGPNLLAAATYFYDGYTQKRVHSEYNAARANLLEIISLINGEKPVEIELGNRRRKGRKRAEQAITEETYVSSGED